MMSKAKARYTVRMRNPLSRTWSLPVEGREFASRTAAERFAAKLQRRFCYNAQPNITPLASDDIDVFTADDVRIR